MVNHGLAYFNQKVPTKKKQEQVKPHGHNPQVVVHLGSRRGGIRIFSKGFQTYINK
jgi:hypothetical protein